MKTFGLFKDDPSSFFRGKRFVINYRIERDKSGPRVDLYQTDTKELTVQITLPFISIWILDNTPMNDG